jgi:hypothetical protein
MEALLAADKNVGDISVQLSIPSSVVVMFATDRARFDSLRAGVDPRNLGGQLPLLPASGGYNYRAGLMRGS